MQDMRMHMHPLLIMPCVMVGRTRRLVQRAATP